MKKYFLYYIAFYALVACACKEKKIPEDVLSVNEMKSVVWDMIEAGAYAEYAKERARDTSRKSLNTTSLAQVLKLHHLTKKEFFRSFNFYQEHPALNKELFDSVNAYAQRHRGELYKRTE